MGIFPPQARHAAVRFGGALAAPSNMALPVDIRLARQAIDQELARRTEPGKGKPIRLDQPSGVQPTDTEKAAMLAVFGTEQPLQIKRTGTAGKATQYSVTLPGHEYSVYDLRTTWPDAVWQYSISGNTIDSTLRWPGLDVHLPDYHINLHDISSRVHQQRASPVRKQRVQAASFDFQELKGIGSVHADSLELREEAILNNQKLDQQVAFAVKRIRFGNGVVLENLLLDLRLRDLDTATWQQLTSATDTQLGALIRTAILQGARLELNDSGIDFGGGRLRVQGNIGMPGVTMDDLASAASAFNAVEAHLNLELPLTTLRSFAMVATHHMLKTPGAQTLDKPAEDVYAYVLGKIIADGYARLEQDKLVAVIDVKRGQVSINGRVRPFTLVQLLAMLNKLAPPLPPPAEDHTPPVALLWRDRPLDDLLLFANNGEWYARRDLCRRYAQAGDAEQAQRWCDKVKLPASEQDQEWETSPDLEEKTLRLSAPAGNYTARYFRFDTSKTRSLRLTLSKPQTHDIWAAGMIVCISAELPSDRACLSLSKYAGVDGMRASSRLYSADQKPMGEEHILEYQASVGAPVQLKIFVDDKQVHFRLGDKELVETAVFPAAVISLSCSTGDCAFGFD